MRGPCANQVTGYAKSDEHDRIQLVPAHTNTIKAAMCPQVPASLTTCSPAGVGGRQLGAGLAEGNAHLATSAVPPDGAPGTRAHVCIGAKTCSKRSQGQQEQQQSCVWCTWID
jgi:hypothetical protein